MSKHELQKIPAANPSLIALHEDMAKALFTGQPLNEQATVLAKQVIGSFVEKSTMMNMVTIAQQLHTMGPLMAGLLNIEDFVYDPAWLAGACNDPKMAHDLYKLFNETIMKRVKFSHDFNKDLSMALEKGIDPEKHLHLHIHSPAVEAQFAAELEDDIDQQKLVSRAYHEIIDVVAAKRNEHEKKKRPSRLLDYDHPDAQPEPAAK